MWPIIWDTDPEIIKLFGNISIRWYSLLFAGGLVAGFQVSKNLFLTDRWSMEDIDKLALFVFIATILGARLGHCLFYEPDYYLSHPLEMLLPFTWKSGSFEMTGFRGLASHGGIFGVLLAIWLFSKKYNKPIFSILDIAAVGGSLAATFIRLGNFMNSEIIGKATGSDIGIVFKKVDSIPRHPGQLYEAFAYFTLFITLFYLYKKKKNLFGHGFIFGLFFTLLFTARFVIEYFKENQVGFENALSFNMGQLLSIPFIIGGLIVMYKKQKKTEHKS